MKPIPASAKTVSLFTGKTDLEDPNARDGSKPDPFAVTRLLLKRPQSEWTKTHGSLSQWRNRAWCIDERNGRYDVSHHGQPHSSHDNIIDAVLATECKSTGEM